MAVTPTSRESGNLTERFNDAGPGGRPLDAERMLASLEAKLFDSGRATMIGRFSAQTRLGAGGMGVVLSAFDPQLERTVAVKVLRSGDADAAEQERLLQEARAMAKLRHPNLVTVYEAGTHQGEVFVVMELVDGGNLRSWLDEQPRSLEEILTAFIGAADGLHAIHAADMVHRDFKPDNVLIGSDGRPQVTDFGLARPQAASLDSAEMMISEDGDPSATRTRGLAGTPTYMAPEVWQGHGADALSDQWSFFVSLYEALYGQRPFEGGTAQALSLAVLSNERTELEGERPVAVPSWLARALERGLSLDARARYPSMRDVIAALRAGEVRKRGRTMAWAALGGAALTAVGVGVLIPSEEPCRDVDAGMEAVWDAQTPAEIERRFAEQPFGDTTWSAVRPRLETYAQAWRDGRQDACRATERGGQSEAALDLRMRCLDRRLREFDGLVRAFEDADATMIGGAVAALGKLPPVDVCADLDFLESSTPAPAEPDARDAVEGVRARFGEYHATVHLGRWDEAESLAASLRTSAEEIGYEPLLAETKAMLAGAKARLGDADGAVALLEQAFEHALASDHLELQVWPAVVSVYVHGSMRKDAEQAGRWTARAEALLRRNDHFPRARRSLHANAANAAAQTRSFEEANARYAKVLALCEASGMASSYECGRYRASLGGIKRRQGKLAEARVLLNDAATTLARELGGVHPELAMMRNMLGALAATAGEPEAALVEYRASVDMFERTVGAEHPGIAHPLNNLGEVLVKLERPAEAMPYLERAAAIWTRDGGAENPMLAYALTSLGEAKRQRGRTDEALVDLERAHALRPKTAAPDEVARTKLALARTLETTDLARARGYAVQIDPAKLTEVALREAVEAWLTRHAE